MFAAETRHLVDDEVLHLRGSVSDATISILLLLFFLFLFLSLHVVVVVIVVVVVVVVVVVAAARLSERWTEYTRA